MLYWNPEQPPGLTPMRSARSSSPSCAMRALTFSAALSVMLTMVVSCCISTSSAVVGPLVTKLLHRRPYTSTPPAQGPAQPPAYHLAEPGLPSRRELPGPRQQRGGVQDPERPLPPWQASVGPDGPLVRGGDATGTSVGGAPGGEVVGLGPGELAHRPFLHPRGPGEEHDPLRGGQGRRVGAPGFASGQHVAQPGREVPVEVLGTAAGEERPLEEGDGGREQ